MTNTSKIIKNMAWMSIAELATKGMSFFLNAYLARVILTEGYGQINFAQSTVIYFMTFVALGFNAIGAREIARNPSNITKYVNNIISIRLILAVIAYMGLAVFLMLMDFSNQQTILVLIASLNIISSSFLLDWYYQGIERMEILGIRQILVASVNLVGVLLLVHSPSDVNNAMYVITGSTVFNAFWLFLLYLKINKSFKFEFDKQFWISIIKESIPISIILLSLVFLTNTGILMVGILLENSDSFVGLYASASKVALLLILPISIIQIAFYPHFSRSDTKEDRQKAFEKFLLLNLLIGFFAASIVYLFSDFVVLTIYGENYIESSKVLKLLMIWAALSYVSQSAMHPMIAWKQEKSFLNIVLLAATINLALCFVLIPKFGIIGAAYSVIITEIFIMISFLKVFMKYIKKYPIAVFIKILLISVSSAFLGYQLKLYLGSNVLGILFAISILITVVLSTKMITIKEIKGYLKK